MSEVNGNGNRDFDEAFNKMRAAARMCMALVEAGNLDQAASEEAMWAGVDAIIESCCRDVKNIWKKRYTVVSGNGDRFKGMLQPKAEANGRKGG